MTKIFGPSAGERTEKEKNGTCLFDYRDLLAQKYKSLNFLKLK